MSVAAVGDSCSGVFTQVLYSYIAFFTGGFGIVEIVDDSNLLLVVGGGKRPFMSPNKVILWDDAKARFVGELEVASKILNVRATKSEYSHDRLFTSFVVVTINNVYVYNRETLRLTAEYSTGENPLGIVATNKRCIVFPDQDRGSITVIVPPLPCVHHRATKLESFI